MSESTFPLRHYSSPCILSVHIVLVYIFLQRFVAIFAVSNSNVHFCVHRVKSASRSIDILFSLSIFFERNGYNLHKFCISTMNNCTNWAIFVNFFFAIHMIEIVRVHNSKFHYEIRSIPFG